MTRILFLLITLMSTALIPTDRADAQTDAEKSFREGEVRNMQILAREKDAKARTAAAEYLGGAKSPDAIAALAAALSDPDAGVRAAAANGLWKSEKAAEPAREKLLKALDDASPEVVVRVASALQSLGMKEVDLAPARKRVLAAAGATPYALFLAARGLIGIEPPLSLLDPMLGYLEVSAAPRSASTGSDAARRNTELCEQALARLAKTGDRSLVVPLMKEARQARFGQVVLIRTLGLFEPKPEGWTELLSGFLSSSDPKVRHAALVQLAKVDNEKDIVVWVPRVAALLRDPDTLVRSQAMWTLGYAGGLAAGHLDAVMTALGDSEASVRKNAVRAIGEMGGASRAVPAAVKAGVAEQSRAALTRMMEKDPEVEVRAEAKHVLRELAAGVAAASVSAASANTGVNAGVNPGAEAAGLAVLRGRNISFDEGSYFRALMESDVEAVRAFLDAGMSPVAPVAGAGPPLRAALFAGSGCSAAERPTRAETKAMVKLLLARGADPNLADGMGNTALMAAAGKGCDRELMKLLLSAGAKPGATNRAGLSAFEMGLFFAHDGLEELTAAGYRLPPAKARTYEQSYAGNAAALALIRKAAPR